MTGWLHGFDWNAIYLGCFAAGLLLSLVAFAGGFSHAHLGHWHFPGHARLLHRGSVRGHQNTAAPFLNGFSLIAFLCWFGGTGYLLSRSFVVPSLVVLGFSLLSGFAAAGLVFWFLAKVLLPRERALEPADTPLVGVLGRVSAPVPPGGVGEMLYTQGGARRSMPIRAEDGASISRGAEVVVLRYQGGVGYVRRWDELQQILMGDDAPAARNLD